MVRVINKDDMTDGEKRISRNKYYRILLLDTAKSPFSKTD